MKKYIVVRTVVSTLETEDDDWEPGEEPSPEGALRIAKRLVTEPYWVEEDRTFEVEGA